MKRIIEVAIFGVLLFAVVIAVLTVWPRYIPQEEVEREREKINEQLPTAEAKWLGANIDDYNLDVTVGAAYCLGQNATLQVRNGEIIEIVGHRDNGDFIIEDFVLTPCRYSDLLPTTMFEWLKQQSDDSYMSATFNSEYGYVEEFHVRSVNRQESHSFFNVEYSNFVPIEESE